MESNRARASKTIRVKNTVPYLLEALCEHPECPDWLSEDLWDLISNKSPGIRHDAEYWDWQLRNAKYCQERAEEEESEKDEVGDRRPFDLTATMMDGCVDPLFVRCIGMHEDYCAEQFGIAEGDYVLVDRGRRCLQGGIELGTDGVFRQSKASLGVVGETDTDEHSDIQGIVMKIIKMTPYSAALGSEVPGTLKNVLTADFGNRSRR